MADTVKISELPVATTSAAADSIPIVQGGVTKQIHPGAGGGLAADSVPDYGIGVTVLPAMVTSCDNYKTAGFFNDSGGLINSPWVGVNASVILVIPYSSTYVVQLAFNAGTAATKKRNLVGGTWGAWYEIFNASTDGNGGQPPAPKPTFGTPSGGADSQGQAYKRTLVGEGLIYGCGAATSKTGTWLLLVSIFTTATGAFLGEYFEIGGGAVEISGGFAANTYLIKSWRLS